MINIQFKNYIDYFQKRKDAVLCSMKISNGCELEKAIHESSKYCNDNLPLDENSFCIFNPNSLMNWIRANENGLMYINESEKKTVKTEKFIDDLLDSYRWIFKKNPIISRNLNNKLFFNVRTSYEGEDGVSGSVVVTIAVDTGTDVENTVNIMARHADLDGYKYIMHHPEGTIKNENGDILNLITIEFEAMYVDGSSIITGEYLYHVTPTSIATRIVDGKVGIVPNSKDRKRKYPDRVYCFVDYYGSLLHLFPKISEKKSKRFINNSRKNEILKHFTLIEQKVNGGLYDTQEFSVLRIDTAKLSNTVFYRDNKFNIDGNFKAVYTTRLIPYYAIDIIENFYLTPDVIQSNLSDYAKEYNNNK